MVVFTKHKHSERAIYSYFLIPKFCKYLKSGDCGQTLPITSALQVHRDPRSLHYLIAWSPCISAKRSNGARLCAHSSHDCPGHHVWSSSIVLPEGNYASLFPLRSPSISVIRSRFPRGPCLSKEVSKDYLSYLSPRPTIPQLCSRRSSNTNSSLWPGPRSSPHLQLHCLLQTLCYW